MGTLQRFDVMALQQRYGLQAFVETGTADGDSLAWAARADFTALHSIEIVRKLANAAIARFAGDTRITVWCCDTALAMPKVVLGLGDLPTLFWLDAHFPGAHHGADYAAEARIDTRLPLERELQAIAARGAASDVILIDDARIYQPGPYEAGNLPDDWPPLQGVTRSLDFVRDLFCATHNVIVDYADQGYVMVCPKSQRVAHA
jgi:hypothetical protein